MSLLSVENWGGRRGNPVNSGGWGKGLYWAKSALGGRCARGGGWRKVLERAKFNLEGVKRGGEWDVL